MKTPPFLLIGCPVIILAMCIVYALTYPALHRTMFHTALIAAEQPASATPDEDPTAAYNRARQIRWAFAQLGLTDAQKQQITQIRRTVADRQQRHEAIMQVLTPGQRAEWEKIQSAPQTESALPATNGVQD
jgi:Spy/CpxP family protein refolding chaperone